MKMVMPGGTGQIGRVLAEALRAAVTRWWCSAAVLRARRASSPGTAGRSGRGRSEMDGADAVINLAGRSVNCRYNKANLTEMLASRVDSTRAVGTGHRGGVAAAPRVAAGEHRDHLRAPL